MAARFERNPAAWPALAHTPEMRALLDRIGHEGSDHARAIAPHASGGYAAGIDASVVDDDEYLTARIMASDPISLQIEYGTGTQILNPRARDGRGRFVAAIRGRPQGGSSPKFHPMLRTLLWLEARE